MRKMIGVLALATGTMVWSSCNSQPPPPPFKPVVDVRQLMAGIIDPSAVAFWDSTGTIVDANGVVERQPNTDEEWTAMRNHAMILAESGNLMMMPRRARDNGDWMKFSQEFIDQAAAAMKAAEARDPVRMFSTGTDLYQACLNCHTEYIAEIKAAQGK